MACGCEEAGLANRRQHANEIANSAEKIDLLSRLPTSRLRAEHAQPNLKFKLNPQPHCRGWPHRALRVIILSFLGSYCQHTIRHKDTSSPL
jgi:hypothetical protein